MPLRTMSVTNVSEEPAYPTKALTKFLKLSAVTREPALIDLGPVVGSNVTFFGEQLGCRIRVEDIAADIDRHVKAGTLDRAAEVFPNRASRRTPAQRRRHPVLGRARLSRSAGGAGAGASSLTRLLGRTARCSGFFSTAEVADAGLHQVHRRGRNEPAVSDLSGAAVRGSGACSTATSSSCSRVCASPIHS